MLNIENLIDFAIRLEEMGEKFFLDCSEKAESDELRKFFKFLADEERGHQKTFKKLKEKADMVGSPDIRLQNEYNDYFNSFVDAILSNEQEMKTITNLRSAIKLAK